MQIINKMQLLQIWLDQEKHKAFSYKSDLKAILLFSGQFSIYLFCLAGAVDNYSLVGNIFFSIITGLALGQLFVMGHDACHQAFAATPAINKILGRIAFSLVLHSYSLWIVLHNQSHHKYTNIKGLDHSWEPMTKTEYDQQNPTRKFLERLYRSPIGAGIYYLIELWGWRLIVPIKSDSRNNWKKHIPDTVLVVLAAIIYPLIVLYLGHLIAPGRSTTAIFLLGWLLPFLSWNWIIGFVTYLHHTHPKITWFSIETSPSFTFRQVHATAHVIFPKPINTILYNIMEHTAHHLLTVIPLYKVKNVQNQLEELQADDIVKYDFTVKEYLKIVKTCKLFDLQRNCWTDFEGNPTSEPIEMVRTDGVTIWLKGLLYNVRSFQPHIIKG